MWFGIMRKPCVSIVGNIAKCETPTFRRASDGEKLVPVCKACEDYDGEIIHSLYDFEIGTNEYLYGGSFNPNYDRWVEVEMGDCRYGCKVYENQTTGRRVLAHNSAYGCRMEL